MAAPCRGGSAAGTEHSTSADSLTAAVLGTGAFLGCLLGVVNARHQRLHHHLGRALSDTEGNHSDHVFDPRLSYSTPLNTAEVRRYGQRADPATG
jgi:hypothetical protein